MTFKTQIKYSFRKLRPRLGPATPRKAQVNQKPTDTRQPVRIARSGNL